MVTTVMLCEACGASVNVQGYGQVVCPACHKLMMEIPRPDAVPVPEPVRVEWEASNGKKYVDQVMGDPGAWVGKYRRIDIVGGMDVRIKIKDYRVI